MPTCGVPVGDGQKRTRTSLPVAVENWLPEAAEDWLPEAAEDWEETISDISV